MLVPLDPLVDPLLAFFTSPIKALGFVTAAASLSLGLVLRWVRRAVRS